MNQLQNLPPVKWMLRHPRLAAWILLSVGMVVLLVIEAKDVGLLATQWAALVIATVLVAGACVWIISWEDSDEETDAEVETTTETPAPSDSNAST
jgi:4-hydroxybenzoate polyprenyltransferase